MTFRVGVTSDIVREDGSLVYPIDRLLSIAEGVEWELLPGAEELGRADVAGRDAVIVFWPRVTAETVAGGEDERPLVLCRLGVGYDRVDVDALTEAGVLLTITPDGVRRPMAAGAMAFVLALAHRVVQKDRLVREGRWDRFAHVGEGLTGRTLGLLGLGNVGRDVCALAGPFGMRRLAHDPYAEPLEGVELVDLETLLRESDFLVVACPLTDETLRLLDAHRLALMKPTAHVVNVARGPIVDQRALTEALAERRIAGAALDVFEREPIDPDDPLVALENVVLAPHAVGLTDELFAESARSACEAVLAVAAGRVPRYVVNPDALAHPRLRRRLGR